VVYLCIGRGVGGLLLTLFVAFLFMLLPPMLLILEVRALTPSGVARLGCASAYVDVLILGHGQGARPCSQGVTCSSVAACN